MKISVFHYCSSFSLLLLVLLISSSNYLCDTAQTSRVSQIWKLPSAHTPPEVTEAYSSSDQELHRFLSEMIPQALKHTGATAFDEHLKGVRDVLRNWESEEHVQLSGLFHSIYGTEGFQGFKLSFSHRKEIRQLIGKKAERLVWIFCVIDRSSIDEVVLKYFDQMFASAQCDISSISLRCRSRLELGNFTVEFINQDEWLDFLELSLADWLEQVEGAAEKKNELFQWEIGEAWSYRRVAYKQMAQILSFYRSPRLQRALAMYNEVFAVEPAKTRHLHQYITPPMSDAAREARAAVASSMLDD